MPPRSSRLAHPRHVVTAILVAHDGAAWLPQALAALSAQTRPPQRVVAVDAGSTDGTAQLLVEALGPDAVVTAAAASGFGSSVRAGLEHADARAADAPAPRRRRAEDSEPPPPPVHWIWILHDDMAPEPGALEALLDAAETTPSAAVLGPKVHDWDDPRLLVEVGLTTDRAGRRETGLERRELDQGQRDSQRDVLAVGSGGALVRRDVWDALGGFDPHLPLFRDDLDFGWRVNAAGHRVVVAPTAVVRHARAALLGRRELAAVHGRATAVDRRHALFMLLANSSALGLLALVPRLLAGALLRTAAFLLTRRVTPAREEIAAVGWNISHVGHLLASRRARRGTRVVRGRDLSPLFESSAARLRGYLEAVGTWITGGVDETTAVGLGEETDDEPPARAQRLRILAGRPGVALTAGLVLVTLLAARDLLGAHRLVGGGLYPPPSGAEDFWAAFGGSWQQAGAGSAATPTPALALLGALATALLGKGWLAVDLLVIGAVPLAGLSAWWASRRVVSSVPLRLWAAVTYALLPVLTGAVAAGRLDATVAAIAMPQLVSGGHRLLVSDPRTAGWRTPFAYGLGLAAVVAFAPQVWPLVGAAVLAGCVVVLVAATPTTRAGAARRIASSIVAVLTPLAVLHPWVWDLLRRPRTLLVGPGEPLAAIGGWDVLLLRPGGPGTGLRWVTVGLVLAALAALLRSHRAATAAAGWALALGSLLAALLISRGPGSLPPVRPYAALAMAACGLLVAALVAAEGAPEQIAKRSFGLVQPAAGALALLAALGPVVAMGSWVQRGADDPLERRPVVELPAVAVSQSEASVGSRVLWLDASDDGGEVAYALVPARGVGLTDSFAPADLRVRRLVQGLVGDITTPRGTDSADALATFAVRFVAVVEPVDPDLAAALDAQAGLSRAAFGGPVQLWRTVTPAARLAILPPALAEDARAGRFHERDDIRRAPPVPLSSRRESARDEVPPGPDGRLLLLSERRDERWVAEVDGEPLEQVTAYGWAQGFELPAEGGELRVWRDAGERHRDLVIQGLLLVVAVVLAAPSVRRGDDADDVTDPDRADDGAHPQDETAEPASQEELTSSGNVRRLT